MGSLSEIFDSGYIQKFSEHLSESNDSLESSTYLAAMIAAPIFRDGADVEKKDEIFHSFTGIFKEITELNSTLENISILEEVSISKLEQLNQQLEEVQTYRDSISEKLIAGDPH